MGNLSLCCFKGQTIAVQGFVGTANRMNFCFIKATAF
ncbi:Uncharacterised protein [Vibrio cholerae]|nr:Uncharacterised protein [Vibrio cholerae]